MNLKNTKRFGLNLTEMTMTLLLIGVICALVVPTISPNHGAKIGKVTLTKIHNSMKEVLDTMLNDSQYYSAAHDFAYKDSNTTPTEFNQKFRKRFAATFVGYTRVPCKIYNGNSLTNISDCYMTSDHITWGVPECDFDSVNVYKKTKNSVVLKYIPITVYADYSSSKDEQNSDYFYNNAVIYGIRKDGDLIFIDDVINKDRYPNAAHYKIREYLNK